MSTRADFYIGRGPDMQWLGSVGSDGFPDEQLRPTNPAWREYRLLPDVVQRAVDRPDTYRNMPFAENPLATAKTADEFRSAAHELIDGRDNGVPTEHGWPWPWNDSSGSNFVYAFDEGELWVSSGGPWYQPHKGQADPCAATEEAYWSSREQLKAALEAQRDVEGATAAFLQAKIAYEAIERPNFPDMSKRKRVSLAAGVGPTVFRVGGEMTSPRED
jgi:hypothetical protein